MTSGLFRPQDERFRETVRQFVDDELRPQAGALERARTFPRRALALCARRGFVSTDARKNAVLAEEMPRCESSGLALSLFVQTTLVAPMIERLGTADQRRHFLAPLLRASRFGAMAVTEPAAGSDVGALETRAVERRGGFELTGAKTYITNGAGADFFIVAALTSPRPDAALSLLLVPASAPGVRVRRLNTLGLSASAMGAITFTRVRVPMGNLLGARGAALSYIQDALNRERLFGGLAAVAWADYALQKAASFARGRRVFGKSITKYQAIRHQFADAATHLEAARQLNYATFSRWLAGETVTKEICMIKLFSYEAAQRAVERCVQIHGGSGYLDDHWVSRFYRDARALTIAAGTPEVMKDMIAVYLRL